MSKTEIYSVGPEYCAQIGETNNAYRGAMYVWDHISRKYFDLDMFPLFDEAMQRRVWNAGNEHPLTDAGRIVLASTMDKVSVSEGDLPRLLAAFDEYAEEHPLSSIGEQAEIIRNAELLPVHKIAWNQTTVGDFSFAPEWNEEDDSYIYSDLGDAWDLFIQFDELSN